MTPEFVADFFYEAMKVIVMLSMPILIIGLVTGVLVSIFQAATSINEMTLVLIPKMLAVGLAIVLFFPWMLQVIVEFTQKIIINLPQYIG